MAFRTWAKLSGTAIGVGALAGASQLGLAFGLGILRLTRVVEVTARDQWIAQLAWVAWIAMTAAAVGGMAARSRLPRSAGSGTRLAAALAAGLGAVVVIPLTMQPARTAQITGVRPVFIIAICAGLGALAGIVFAYAAISRAVARWSLVTVVIAVWVVAIVSVAPSLRPDEPLPSIRLGVFDPVFLDSSITRRTALFTMPALALLCGLILGLVARRRGLSTMTIALAGLPGPATLTVAYLIAGPGAGPDQYAEVPYWAAMTAAGAGVLGSVLAAVLRRPESSRGPADSRAPVDGRGARDSGNSPSRDSGNSPSRDSGDSPSKGNPSPAESGSPSHATASAHATVSGTASVAAPGTGRPPADANPTPAPRHPAPSHAGPAQPHANPVPQARPAHQADPAHANPAQPHANPVPPTRPAHQANAPQAHANPVPHQTNPAPAHARPTAAHADPAAQPPPLPRREAQATSSAIAAAAAAAAKRPNEQLRPSDTGVFTVEPFDGFASARTEPQPAVGRARADRPADRPADRGPNKGDGEFVDWVSGLGNN